MNAMKVTTALQQSLRIGAARIKRFVSDEQGVTAIEYGLIAALIAVVIIGAVKTVGEDLNSVFTTIGNDL